MKLRRLIEWWRPSPSDTASLTLTSSQTLVRFIIEDNAKMFVVESKHIHKKKSFIIWRQICSSEGNHFFFDFVVFCVTFTMCMLDTCYVLSFAIIMLNTSLHNPSVKVKQVLQGAIGAQWGNYCTGWTYGRYSVEVDLLIIKRRNESINKYLKAQFLKYFYEKFTDMDHYVDATANKRKLASKGKKVVSFSDSLHHSG